MLRWGNAQRWGDVDVLTLQECEGARPYDELLERFEFVGAVSAEKFCRGYVHLYVRKGVAVNVIVVEMGRPCVFARLQLPASEERSDSFSLIVGAVHLPSLAWAF